MFSSSHIHGQKNSKEQEYLEGWQRARADLENVRRRMAESTVNQKQALKRDIVEDLLGLADNFRALTAHAPDPKDPWVQGVLHVARQFEQVLADFGVEIIADTGGAFDPKIHEAVEEVEGKESGIVQEVVQAGYKIGETVIRPAKVKITS